MAIDRSDFEKITNREYAALQALVQESEAAASTALSTSGAAEDGEEQYQVSHLFYSDHWNTSIYKADEKLRRRKAWVLGHLYILLLPLMGVAGIISLYWFFSTNSTIDDKISVLMFAGYISTVFFVFVGISVFSEIKKFYNERLDFRFNTIFHGGVTPELKTAMVPGRKGLYVAKVSGDSMSVLEVPYSEIFASAIVPINSRTKLVRKYSGPIETMSIEEQLDDDVMYSDYDEVRIFKQSGRQFSLLEPKGKNGGTREDLVRIISERSAASSNAD